MKALRRLSRRRSARFEAQEFLVDGPTLISEALESGATLKRVYVESSALSEDVVWAVRREGVDVAEVADGALGKVLDVVSPQAMVGVAAFRRAELADLVSSAVETSAPLLVLDCVADPGNVGTLIRVAEAAGAAGAVLCAGTADRYNPKTVRSTAGSIFRVPVCDGVSIDTVFEACSRRGLATWATVAKSGTSLDDADLRRAGALFIGSEAHGLAHDVVDACEVTLRIPMEGRVESLNAAVAGSVVLFEAARQRRGISTPHT